MLKTYFFIPATQKKFINKIPEIRADEFVFDLEDAIAPNKTEEAFKNLEEVENISDMIVRPRLYSNTGKLKDKNLERLIDMGVHRFFIPKADNPEMLDDLLNVFNYYDLQDLQWYYLIESPKALMYLKDMTLVQKYPFKGLCLGSQDYAAQIGMAYSLEAIQWARTYVLNIAKACNIEAIDIASMVIKDKKLFSQEVESAFNMGYDAKLIIHPNQLDVIESHDYYSDEDIRHAMELNEKADLKQLEDFSVVTIDGMAYERPHINRVLKIIEYIEKKQRNNS